MSARLFLVPNEVTSALARDRRGPDDGLLIITARPHRNQYALHMDLLAGLGARDDVFCASKKPGPERELMLLQSWIVAHRIRLVVVAHADMIPMPQWFGPVTDAVEAAGAVLALVCDDDIDPARIAAWLDSVEGISGDVDDLQALLPASAPHPVTEPDVGPPNDTDDFPVLLPQAAFYLFRARCRDLLPVNEFEQVDALYREAFTLFRDMPDPTADRVGAQIVASAALFTCAGQAYTFVRAAQAALFTRGLRLRVHIDPLLRAVRDDEHRPATPAELKAMRAYREPWIPVAAVVRNMELEFLNMKNMKLRNVDEEGRYTQRGLNRGVPDGARVLLRAQRHLRILEGAGPDDRFLTQDSTAIAEAFRRVKIDLNLPGIQNQRRPVDNTWQDKLRIGVLPLAGRGDTP